MIWITMMLLEKMYYGKRNIVKQLKLITIMGFWKDVSYDMSRGMSKQTAINLNYQLRYAKLTEQEKRKAEALAEAEVKLNTML